MRHHRFAAVGATLVVLTMALAVVVTPWVAARIDFGHTHPEDTPPHIHSILSVLAANTPPAPLAVLPTAALARGQATLAAPTTCAEPPPTAANGCRAPPELT